MYFFQDTPAYSPPTMHPPAHPLTLQFYRKIRGKDMRRARNGKTEPREIFCDCFEGARYLYVPNFYEQPREKCSRERRRETLTAAGRVQDNNFTGAFHLETKTAIKPSVVPARSLYLPAISFNLTRNNYK